jgi:hypothetical protein
MLRDKTENLTNINRTYNNIEIKDYLDSDPHHVRTP